jgi:hypothetical protein
MVKAVSYDEWLRLFGTQLEWHQSDSWYPVSGPGGFAMLAPGEDPNDANTEYAIQRLNESRGQRNLTESDFREREERVIERRKEQIGIECMELLPALSDHAIHVGGKNNWSVGSDIPTTVEEPTCHQT